MMLADGFWQRDFTPPGYSQIYSVLAVWQAQKTGYFIASRQKRSHQAELGLPVEELVGHTVCRSCYEDYGAGGPEKKKTGTFSNAEGNHRRVYGRAASPFE